jgi:hypothetical protein
MRCVTADCARVLIDWTKGCLARRGVCSEWLLFQAARVVRLKSSHVCIPTALSAVLRVQGCGVWGVGCGWVGAWARSECTVLRSTSPLKLD